MIKRVGIFSLAQGKDPEEVWKFYAEVHAPDVASRTPGLRKYVISRAIEPWIERRGLMGGEPRWWGILEQWYDSREASEQAVRTPRPSDEFVSRFMDLEADASGVAYVEEKVIV